MNSSTLDRVIAIIAGAAGLGADDEIDASMPLIGSGISLDSAAVLEILVGIEKEFGVEIDVDELLSAQGLRSISALADFVDSRADTAT